MGSVIYVSLFQQIFMRHTLCVTSDELEASVSTELQASTEADGLPYDVIML